MGLASARGLGGGSEDRRGMGLALAGDAADGGRGKEMGPRLREDTEGRDGRRGGGSGIGEGSFGCAGLRSGRAGREGDGSPRPRGHGRGSEDRRGWVWRRRGMLPTGGGMGMGSCGREDTGEGARIGGGWVWWRRGMLPTGGGKGMGFRRRGDTREGARIGGGWVWRRRGILPTGGGRDGFPHARGSGGGWVPACAGTREREGARGRGGMVSGVIEPILCQVVPFRVETFY